MRVSGCQNVNLSPATTGKKAFGTTLDRTKALGDTTNRGKALGESEGTVWGLFGGNHKVEIGKKTLEN